MKGWFDEAGRPRLGSLAQHHPTNHPSTLRNLHWTPANAQHVLDVALAWACMNRHFEIASFLLERGANINTDWSTHEPASILHECAIHGNYEAAQFLIDHGIDMTIRDYRWNATAEGWAIQRTQWANLRLGIRTWRSSWHAPSAHGKRSPFEKGTVLAVQADWGIGASGLGAHQSRLPRRWRSGTIPRDRLVLGGPPPGIRKAAEEKRDSLNFWALDFWANRREASDCVSCLAVPRKWKWGHRSALRQQGGRYSPGRPLRLVRSAPDARPSLPPVAGWRASRRFWGPANGPLACGWS